MPNDSGVKTIIESKDWWFFPIVLEEQIKKICALENKFYAPGTKANGAFHIVMLLSGSIALAHKSLLPRKNLAKFLGFDIPNDEQDIVILIPSSISTEGRASLVAACAQLVAQAVNLRPEDEIVIGMR